MPRIIRHNISFTCCSNYCYRGSGLWPL